MAKDLHYRLLCMSGGCSEVWGVHSCEGGIFSVEATYGSDDAINTRDDLLNSRLIIMWGGNPTDTVMFTNTVWYLIQAKEAGTKIVCVDPKGLPILPLSRRPVGTNQARHGCRDVNSYGLCHNKENLQDQRFLDTYTVGFEKFKDYVMGGRRQTKDPGVGGGHYRGISVYYRGHS